MKPIPSTKSPHTFAEFTTQKGARIYRIPMQAFPGFWAYAYLVFVDDLIVLIDTGSGFGDCNEQLEEGFERVRSIEGLASVMDNLDYILITHGTSADCPISSKERMRKSASTNSICAT